MTANSCETSQLMYRNSESKRGEEEKRNTTHRTYQHKGTSTACYSPFMF